MRMLGARQRNHRKAVRKGRQVLLQLVRRTAGGDEMNFVEIKSPVRRARNGKVAVMNRVERPAKNRDAARMVLCGGAVSLRGGQCFSGS